VQLCREIERTERDLILSGKKQGLRFRDIGGAVLFFCRHIPAGMFNYATGISSKPAGVNELLGKIEDFYARLNVPPRVVITPLSRPRDLRSRLLKRGYKESSKSDVMIIGSEARQRKTRSDMKARPVLGGQVEAFSSIFNSAFRIPLGLKGAFTRFWRSAVFDSDRRLGIYLATLDREPVGIGLIFVGERAAGLYCVATKPGCRHRGVAANLVSQAVQNAFTSKAKFVYLYASRGGNARKMYRSLGFSSKYVRSVYSLDLSTE